MRRNNYADNAGFSDVDRVVTRHRSNTISH